MNELGIKPALDKITPTPEEQRSYDLALAFCREHQDGTRHPSSLTAEYVTDIPLEEYDKLAQRMLADKVLFRQKYQLPDEIIKKTKPETFLAMLRKIAEEKEIKIEPSTKNLVHLSTPMANGSAYDKKTKTIYWEAAEKHHDLEHELIHALQDLSGQKLTREMREYEAYCAGVNAERLVDPDWQADILGIFWGSITLVSCEGGYESAGLDNPWLYGYKKS